MLCRRRARMCSGRALALTVTVLLLVAMVVTMQLYSSDPLHPPLAKPEQPLLGKPLAPQTAFLAVDIAPSRATPIPFVLKTIPIPTVVHRVFGLWKPDYRVDATVGWIILDAENVARLLPRPYSVFTSAWLADLSSGWTHKLWDKLGSEELIQTHHSDLLETWGSYLHPVQRADIMRYAMLSTYGGVYMDLDVAPRPEGVPTGLAALFRDNPLAGAIFFVEANTTAEDAARVAMEQPIRRGVPEDQRRIANYLMACRPGHPIMADILELAKARALEPVRNDYDVLYTTGPDLVSTVVNQHTYADVLVVAASESRLGVQHLVSGGWRTMPLQWHHPGWDAWLQQEALRGWVPPWLRP